MKFEVKLTISICNAEQSTIVTLDELGLTEEEWIKLSDDEQTKLLFDYADETLQEYIEYSWEEVVDPDA